MRVDVGTDDRRVEVFGEIEDEVVDTQLLRNSACVIDITDRAATGVTLAAPEAHGDTHDFMTLSAQLGSGNRRVDPTGHRNEHLHGKNAIDCYARRRCTLPTTASAAALTSSCVVV